MIECIFTIDYEIYGNGNGDLDALVYQPTEQLLTLFKSRGKRLVLFVEAAELEAIEAAGADSAIGMVKEQIRRAYEGGFEIGLHLHPQWYNAAYRNGRWLLDYKEYNLCRLTRARMIEIVDRSISYLRDAVGDPNYKPTSFRAGNWLFQPTELLAQVLAARGVKVDSSVFKGGLQRLHGLDYRGAIGNGYWWRFSDRVDVPNTSGMLVEIPTYTELVPPWTMVTRKRLAFRRSDPGSPGQPSSRFMRAMDLVRLRYPLKLDFCRMTLKELLPMIDRVIKADARNPQVFRPIVAIGHTKDLVDHETVALFLDALRERGIAVSTLEDASARCDGVQSQDAALQYA